MSTILIFNPKYQLAACLMAALRTWRNALRVRREHRRKMRFLKRARPFMESGQSQSEKAERHKEETRLYTWFLLRRGQVRLRRLERLLQKSAAKNGAGFLIRLKSEDEWSIQTRINYQKGQIIKWEKMLGIGAAIQKPRDELDQ